MAKFRAEVDEMRYIPELGITINPNDIVDLPDNIKVSGLVPVKESDAKVAPVKTAAVAADEEGV